MAKKNEATPVSDNVELVLTTRPDNVLDLVKNDQAKEVSTKQLNIFYVRVDAAEKFVKHLKEKIRQVIIDRCNEGDPAGEKLQHREFAYNTPQGRCELTVQERRSWKPNVEKLTELLHEKKLWSQATTFTIKGESEKFRQFMRKYRKSMEMVGAQITEEIDQEKVNGLFLSKQITTEELESILDKPDPTYALIAKLKT